MKPPLQALTTVFKKFRLQTFCDNVLTLSLHKLLSGPAVKTKQIYSDKDEMTMKPRLLTKSRFKIGSECPTKLFFTGKAEYGSNKVDNSFLEALAEGGFQVGELAKLYHPGGVNVEELDINLALAKTAKLLEQENVTIYEPAFRFGDFFVRVDILVKKGTNIELIEVKAKSIDPDIENEFYNLNEIKKGVYKFHGDWEEYLLDVAFQGMVIKGAEPSWQINHFLMLANTKATANIDALNQLFLIEKSGINRVKATVRAGVDPAKLGNRVLVKIPVDKEAKVAHTGIYAGGRSFVDHAQYLANTYKDNVYLLPPVSSKCKTCEFRISEKEIEAGKKSGFNLCWQTAEKLSDDDFKRPFAFDLWNFKKFEAVFDSKRIFMDELDPSDILPKPKPEPKRTRKTEKEPESKKPGLSQAERQLLQFQKVKSNDEIPFVDLEGLALEFDSFDYPLHFIDFETSTVAIPFNKGRRPYETIVFQFSHHIINEEGVIEHKNEYINRSVGEFPNFEFVRELKKAIGTKGTIFRYSSHENTVLNQIIIQLVDSNESDREELISWIESITHKKEKEVIVRQGPRDMMDLWDFVKKYYYHPATKGSNSIKHVLPAILGSSQYLQNKFSKANYGSPGGIVSKNFKDHPWIQFDQATGKVIDPYKLLPPIFDDLSLEEMDSLITPDSIADGGAAMTAYARMQFTEMSAEKREALVAGLLKYCELDTLAMVMIYLHWKHLIDLHTQVKKSA